MSTYNAIRYNVDYANVGSLKLLSTQTASASASISFTTGIDSTYDEYWFIFNNCHPSSDGQYFTFQGSTNGGSSYGVTMTTTAFQSYHNEANTDTVLTYAVSDDLAQSTSYQRITTSIGADNDQSTSGILKLYNPSSTTYVKHFIDISNGYNQGDYSVHRFHAGYFNTTSAINAIDFKFASGNIDDGTIQLFGVKQ